MNYEAEYLKLKGKICIAIETLKEIKADCENGRPVVAQLEQLLIKIEK